MSLHRHSDPIRGRQLRLEALERRDMLSGAPPVVFAATGSASFHFYGHWVTPLDIHEAPIDGWQASLQSPFPTGSIGTTGHATPSTLTATWQAEDVGGSTHWNDNGAGVSTSISVYVRDDLNAPVPFSIELRESYELESANTATQFRGTLLTQDTAFATTSQSEARSETFTGVAGGIATFADYPGVAYRLARTFDNTVYVVTPYGQIITVPIFGSVSGTATIEALINRGDAPLIDGIDAPEKVSKGQTVRFDAFAWDPDNGPTSDGNGIAYYQWEITSPTGQKARRQGADLQVLDEAFSEVGKYGVTLTVFDDEGMKATVVQEINVSSDVDLHPLSIVITADGRGLLPGSALPVNWTLTLSALVHNYGTTDSEPSTATFYISRDDTLGDDDDITIASIPVPRIGSGITDTSLLLVSGGIDALVNIPDVGYSLWYDAVQIGVIIDSGNVMVEVNETNNTATTRVKLVDGVPERTTAAANLTYREALEWMRRNGFTEVPWALRELPGYLGFDGGDLGFYKALTQPKKIVSPYDGRERDGRWYRQQALVQPDDLRAGKFKITLQGTESFGEPDPWYATKRAYSFPWWTYVGRWHNTF